MSVPPVPAVPPSSFLNKFKEKEWNAARNAVEQVSFALERQPGEAQVEHLLRHAGRLALSDDQVSRLLAAYRLTIGPFASKTAQAAAVRQARSLVSQVDSEVSSAAAAAVADAAAAHLAGLKADRQRLDGDLTEAGLLAARTLDREIRSAEKGNGKGCDFNNVGAKRIKSRDGLFSLVESGALNRTEDQVARAYRLLFEHAGKGAGLGSQLEDRPRTVRDSSHSAVAAGLYRAYVGVRLTGVETAVASADRTGRALSVLRAVAGEGRTIRSLGGGGNTRDANQRALHLALRVALAALQGNGGLRIGGQ